MQGGERLGWRTSDDELVDIGSETEDNYPDVPPSFIRTQALVSLLRSIPMPIVGPEGTPIRREWEIRAVREMDQLARMQGVRYL